MQEAPTKCPTCATVNAASDQRCVSCGALLNQPPAAPAPVVAPVAEEPAKKGLPVIGYVAIALVVTLVLGVILALRPKAPKPPDPRLQAIEQNLVKQGYRLIPALGAAIPMNQQTSTCFVNTVAVERYSGRRFKVTTALTNNVGRSGDEFLTAFLYDAEGRQMGAAVVLNYPMEFLKRGTSASFEGFVPVETADEPRFVVLVSGKETADKMPVTNMSLPVKSPR